MLPAIRMIYKYAGVGEACEAPDPCRLYQTPRPVYAPVSSMQGDLSYAALDVLECEDISHTCQRLAPSALAARHQAPRYGWKRVTRGHRTQRPQGPEPLGKGTMTPRANTSPSSLTAFLLLA